MAKGADGQVANGQLPPESSPETKAVVSGLSKHFSFYAPYSQQGDRFREGSQFARGHTAARETALTRLRHPSDFGEHSGPLGPLAVDLGAM